MSDPEVNIGTVGNLSETTLEQQLDESAHTANELEKQSQALERRVIEERSLMLASLISELSCRRKGLSGTKTPDSCQLLMNASELTKLLGISKLIAIYDDQGKRVAKEREGEDTIQRIGDIRNALPRIRKQRKLSQATLGELLGVSRYTIMRAEKGDISLRSKHMSTLEAFIDSANEDDAATQAESDTTDSTSVSDTSTPTPKSKSNLQHTELGVYQDLFKD